MTKYNFFMRKQFEQLICRLCNYNHCLNNNSNYTLVANVVSFYRETSFDKSPQYFDCLAKKKKKLSKIIKDEKVHYFFMFKQKCTSKLKYYSRFQTGAFAFQLTMEFFVLHSE